MDTRELRQYGKRADRVGADREIRNVVRERKPSGTLAYRLAGIAAAIAIIMVLQLMN